MIREEQIVKAAHEYIQSGSVAAGNEVLAFGDFINGAKWADSHPQWIPVEEELPVVGETVQIYVEDLDDVVYGALQLTGDWWCEEYGCNFSNITCWMRKPAAPKKED